MTLIIKTPARSEKEFYELCNQMSADTTGAPYEQIIVYDGIHLCVSPNPDAESEPADSQELVPYESRLMCDIKDLLDEALEIAHMMPQPTVY